MTDYSSVAPGPTWRWVSTQLHRLSPYPPCWISSGLCISLGCDDTENGPVCHPTMGPKFQVGEQLVLSPLSHLSSPRWWILSLFPFLSDRYGQAWQCSHFIPLILTIETGVGCQAYGVLYLTLGRYTRQFSKSFSPPSPAELGYLFVNFSLFIDTHVTSMRWELMLLTYLKIYVRHSYMC